MSDYMPQNCAAKLREARLALDAIQHAAAHWAALNPANTTALLIASLAKEILERAE